MTDEFAAQLSRELSHEQEYVDRAYGLLEAMRVAAARIAEGFEKGAGGTHQARLERELAEETSRRRLSELNIGDLPLCFGRLDLNGESHDNYYIGRLSVSDGNQDPVVVDWRAPVAEPFYRATPSNPMDVVRRRHFQLEGRHIVSLDDEVFDQKAADDASLTVVGEAALLAALERNRTGQMQDIISTIQADQDRAIRGDLSGVLVVTGGPGTGKTAVALHRAAYLLYTHRSKLTAQGVLIVGPNPLFLHYIDEVLPSLGEDDVQLSTITSLKPQLRSKKIDPPDVAEIKGDKRMAQVIHRALSDRQRALFEDAIWSIDGRRLTLTRKRSAQIVSRARRRKGTHNEHRPAVVRMLLDHLVEEYLKQGTPPSGTTSDQNSLLAQNEDGVPANDEYFDQELRSRLRAELTTREVLGRMWPIISGEQLVNDLLGFEPLLASASKGILSAQEQKRLLRDHEPELKDVTWTTSDVGLVDEADALCGATTAAMPKKKRSKTHQSAIATAAQVIGDYGLAGFMTPEDLAVRQGMLPTSEPDTQIQRQFGHVLVDEAQDLTSMEWRMLSRRCPAASMTLVGDFGQASQPGALSSWKEVFDELNTTNADIAELRVNYRTPAEIMRFANPLLHKAAPHLRAPNALRETGEEPEVINAANDDLVLSVHKVVSRRVQRGGMVSVIAPDFMHDELKVSLSEYLNESDPLEGPAVVLDAQSAKGLEFDHVVAVEPSFLIPEEPRGLRLLYVVFTRATRTLAVVHKSPLPAELLAPVRVA